MEKVTHPLVREKYTELWHEEELRFGAPHHFEIKQRGDAFEPKVHSFISFQKGPIKEVGINGIMNEDLLAMVLIRLEGFQKTEFACRENAIAITKLEEALMWLNRRTKERELRGVEGTSEK